MGVVVDGGGGGGISLDAVDCDVVEVIAGGGTVVTLTREL